MNRRSITIAATTSSALALLLMWWMSRREPKPQPDSAASGVTRQDMVSASPSATTPIREEERKQKQEERAKTIFQAIEGTNVPINFWGKVIDQDKRPIAGVKVSYNYSTEHGNIVGVAWGRQKIYKDETATDGAGSFAVTGLRGHDLTLESLNKEGYQYTPRGAAVYNFYGNTSGGKFTPDPNNPVLFVMVNKATAEPLVSYGGHFGKTMRVPGNGTPTRWNLWKGQSDANGELQITFTREPAVLARVGPPVTWSAKIEVIGGGIIEAPPDEAIYRAPEEGYASAVDYPKTEQKRGVSARSFYVKTADGRYGRLQLEIYPGDQGPTARCLIKASMNPSGSPNLESPAADQPTAR